MGSVADDQRGAAAGVNNTTRELGGTLGVAVFGSIFASSYAPKIISAFRADCPSRPAPRPKPTSPWQQRWRWSAHAPRAAQPALRIDHVHRVSQRLAGGVHRGRRGCGAGRARRCAAPARAELMLLLLRTRMRHWMSAPCGGSGARPVMTGPGWQAIGLARPSDGGSAIGGATAKVSGACRTPAMTGLAVRSTGPAGSSEAKRSTSSLEHDPGLEPGQGGAEAEVGPESEAHVWIGVAVDAELTGVGPEHLFVTVGRGVHEQHGVTFGNRLTPDGGGGRWPCA